MRRWMVIGIALVGAFSLLGTASRFQQRHPDPDDVTAATSLVARRSEPRFIPHLLERGHRRSHTPDQVEGKECERSGRP